MQDYYTIRQASKITGVSYQYFWSCIRYYRIIKSEIIDGKEKISQLEVDQFNRWCHRKETTYSIKQVSIMIGMSPLSLYRILSKTKTKRFPHSRYGMYRLTIADIIKLTCL